MPTALISGDGGLVRVLAPSKSTAVISRLAAVISSQAAVNHGGEPERQEDHPATGRRGQQQPEQRRREDRAEQGQQQEACRGEVDQGGVVQRSLERNAHADLRVGGVSMRGNGE